MDHDNRAYGHIRYSWIPRTNPTSFNSDIVSQIDPLTPSHVDMKTLPDYHISTQKCPQASSTSHEDVVNGYMYCKRVSIGSPGGSCMSSRTELDDVANDTHDQETHSYCLADLCEFSPVG